MRVESLIRFLETETGGKVLEISEDTFEVGNLRVETKGGSFIITVSPFGEVLPHLFFSKGSWYLRFFSPNFSSVPQKPILREIKDEDLEGIFSPFFDGKFSIKFLKENRRISDIEDLIRKIKYSALEAGTYSYLEVSSGTDMLEVFVRTLQRFGNWYFKVFPERKSKLDRIIKRLGIRVFSAVGAEWVEAKGEFGKILISREVGGNTYGIFLHSHIGKNLFKVSKEFGNSPFTCGAFPDSLGDYTFLGYDSDLDEIKEKIGRSYEVHISFESLSEKEEEVIDILNRYGNVLLVGPPGTGKTYTARRVARYLAGNEGEGWILIQASPSFEYENFVEGLKPVDVGGIINFKVVEGPFLRMVNKALNERNRKFVVIIDEINRGNAAALLGELIYALEYRESPVIMPYSSKPLKVPKNLYVIATLNERDINTVKLDQAILRRFPVVFFEPSRRDLEDFLRSKGWKEEDIKEVLETFDRLNELTNNSLGHTYFFAENPDEFHRKLEYFIKPLLRLHFGIREPR